MVKSLGLGNGPSKAPKNGKAGKQGAAKSKSKQEPKKPPPRAMVVQSLSSRANQKGAKKGANDPSASDSKKNNEKNGASDAAKSQSKTSFNAKKGFDAEKYKTTNSKTSTTKAPNPSSSSASEKLRREESAKSRAAVDHSAHKKSWWFTFERSSKKPLISMEGVEKWYEITPSPGDVDGDVEESLDESKEAKRLDSTAMLSLEDCVEKNFESEVNAYKKHRNTHSNMDGDQKWMNDMIKSGTLSDKIAAMTLLVGESPVHQLETLDTLIYMALKKEQRTANLALEAIKDLFIHNLLPDQHLKAFRSQPLGHPDMTMERAMAYWYESELLKRVVKVMGALDQGVRGTIDHFKKQCT